jgi:hypothetical protein
MRIQAGDIFVNSLEGLLFSTPLLLSPINARGGDGIIAVGLPGARALRFGARVGGPESENVEQISEDRNDGRSD